MRLAEFIDKERLTIVAEWEAFARTMLPAATGLSALALRDHADDILTAIVRDMNSRQTLDEQAEKSKGHGRAQRLGTMGEIHAALRIEIGFKLGQMVAEYRALRASVLRLWEKIGGDPGGVTRFNEAIDEALTVAVESFTETAERYRDQSLGILSHDLRNPLNGILLGASSLAADGKSDAARVGMANRMVSSARRMDRMIGDLLDLTRTRFGKQIPVARVEIDLEPLCSQVVGELEGFRPVAIKFTHDGDLRGVWDGDRLAQVLSNLLRNAMQHSQSTVSLAVHGEPDHVVVKVHNAGPGIPRAALAKIFEPMMRDVEDERSNPGLGLGLYIALQIVLAHNGTLDVTSTDGEGTTFTVRLPRLIPAEPPTETPPVDPHLK